jgi:organic radical activating enzyme
MTTNIKKQRLSVSECFYSIQGEGQTMGIPAVFLRLGGCNLLCESANWRCDTIEVWRKSKSIEFHNVFDNEMLQALMNGAHLVITGGEPLMHQVHIINFIEWFQEEYKFIPTLEIETNGTIIANDQLNNYVDYWNVSPKLSTAGEQNSEELRINKVALQSFNNFSRNVIFKFVISCEDDLVEMKLKFECHINPHNIVLMPAGSSQSELETTRQMVAQMCKDNHYRYSERLHVVIWNLKTGV